MVIDKLEVGSLFPGPNSFFQANPCTKIISNKLHELMSQDVIKMY